MRFLGIGCGWLVFSALIGVILANRALFMELIGFAGFGCWLLGAIYSGALLSGDRIRANAATETVEDRRVRNRRAWQFFLIGLPNVLTAILILSDVF